MSCRRNENVMSRIQTKVKSVLSVVVAGAFLISGISHIVSPYFFLQSILDYDLVHRGWSEVVATGLMFLNLCTGAAILSTLYDKVIYVVASTLMLLYLSAQLSAMVRGLKIGCGCFGPNSEFVGVGSLTITSSLLLCCVAILFIQRQAASYSNGVKNEPA